MFPVSPWLQARVRGLAAGEPDGAPMSCEDALGYYMSRTQPVVERQSWRSKDIAHELVVDIASGEKEE
jgi:hypothetical protein